MELHFAEGVVPEELGGVRGAAIADLAGATAAALANPTEYPPLSLCTTPTDRIVLAVAHDTPQAAQVLRSTIEVLTTSGVEPHGISVLQPPAEHGGHVGNPCRLLPAALRDQIAVHTHDPEDRRQLAYLAANEAGEAILIHRDLHEADMVLPIGCVRDDHAPGYFGIHGSVFPVFSDTKTLQRFRGAESLNEKVQHRRALLEEVDHVAGLLGINFTIQLVPGSGDEVLDVLAGESEAVRKHAQTKYRAAWNWPNSQRTSLVVAGIDGDASQQTWENLGRVLQTAEKFVEPDGAIAVCSDLATKPGSALRRMASSRTPEAGFGHGERERPCDSLVAMQFAHALRQHKIYLLSRLEGSVVEELNITPIASSEEMDRLVRKHPTCTLLSNATRVMVE